VAYAVNMSSTVNVMKETITCQSRANIAARQMRDALGLASVVPCGQKVQVKYGSLDVN
jgi:hypothetical protein